MSNFNTCEHEHQDVDGFIDAVAAEGSALRVAAALRGSRIVRLERTPTILDFISGNVPPEVNYETPSGKFILSARRCAEAILSGECQRYEFEPNESLLRFHITAKR